MLLKRLAEIVGALTQFLQQPRVFDGDDSLLCEILDQCDLLVCERLHFLAIDRNHADQFVFLQHRYDDDGASAGDIGDADNSRVSSKVSRTLSDIINLYDPTSLDDGGVTAFRMRTDQQMLPQSSECRRKIVLRSDIVTFPIPQIHHAEICPADACGVFKHLLEHRLQFARRGADDLQHLRGCGLLLERFSQIIRALTQLFQQPRIFNSNGPLLREVCDEINLLIAKKAHLTARQRKHADTDVVLEHRNRKHGADAGYFDRRHRQRIPTAIGRSLAQVGHLYRLATLRGTGDRRIRAGPGQRSASPLLDVDFRIWTVQRGAAESIALAQPDYAVSGFTEAHGAYQHGLENRLQFTWRGADDLQHLRGRRLLLQGFAQLCGPLLNLVLQVGVGFLQPRAHVVELIGEAFEFVAGFDRNALGEIAAADTLGADAQRLDRPDHAPRQKYPGEHREDRRTQQHDGKALQRRIERRVGLLHRQFDKHRPAQRRDRRGCRQHLLPLDIQRTLQRVGAACVSALRGLHLLQPGHIGVAQHQTDIGMRDQPTSRADNIGVAALADLDLGNHVPDQLEVDLGNADAGILAGAGQRQRHVGLGLPAEINRPVIDLVGDGFGEFRILGEIEPAVDHVHGETRYPQALPAGRIDLRQLGDGGLEPQQPQGIEPAILERTRRPRQLGGPAELTFNFLDELADLGRRRLGLLALNPDQGRLVLAIIEENLEDPVG